MSETVSKDLMLSGGNKAFEKSLVIGKADKSFNTLNITSLYEGLKARKPFQKP